MLHTALEFLKGSCGFWILSTVYRVILRILDPVKPFCRRILFILDPVFGHGTCLTPMRLGQSVQKVKTHFSSATLCILLHLLSWENVSKALNPAGFSAFDKFPKAALM